MSRANYIYYSSPYKNLYGFGLQFRLAIKLLQNSCGLGAINNLLLYQKRREISSLAKKTQPTQCIHRDRPHVIALHRF